MFIEVEVEHTSFWGNFLLKNVNWQLKMRRKHEYNVFVNVGIGTSTFIPILNIENNSSHTIKFTMIYWLALEYAHKVSFGQK